MEIDAKPPKLKAQEQKPGLVSFMKDAVEESINKQLDKAWKKDVDPDDSVEKAPVQEESVTKMSEADFYVKVGSALMKKRLERKIKTPPQFLSKLDR